MSMPWQSIKQRYDNLTNELLNPSLDPARRSVVQRELSHLTTLLAQHNRVEQLVADVATTKQLLEQEADPEMKELYVQELMNLEQQCSQEEKQLASMLCTPDELDDRSVFLEIRAGAGGQEAALFVGDLMRMYMNFAAKRGWKASVESVSETDLGGYREVVLHIAGKEVYGNLKRESGVHRVQRVPATETQGRVHTSTATVAVLPEAEEVDLSINPADLRIDVYRASGAGGQHVNTTDSAVRITHIPSGVMVSCQDERSQHKNKAKALKILQARLLAAKKEEHDAQMRKERKEQVGTGMRAEKVRTYNYPQNRVTDHQVDVTLKKLDMVMEGALDEIIDALRAQELEARKKEFVSKFV